MGTGVALKLAAGAMVEITLPQWLVFNHELASRHLEGEVLRVTDRGLQVDAWATVRESENCLRCGREIINPVSQLAGYGPICSDYVGISRDFTPAQIQEQREATKTKTRKTMWLPLNRITVEVVQEAPPPKPVAAVTAQAPAADEPVYVGAATVQDGRILIRSQFRFKDALKAIPGAKASYVASKFQGWTYPTSPTTAAAICKVFGSEPFRQDAGFVALLQQGAAVGNAAAVKLDADNLPDIPNTKLPAWKHQRLAYWFAEKLPAAMLALDMGCGKSFVVVSLVVNRGHKRTLVIGPNSVIENDVWGKEFRKHAGIDVKVVTLNGSVAKKRDQAVKALDWQKQTGRPLVIAVNYESAWREPLAELLLKVDWDCVAVDEIHKIKSGSGKASTYIGKLGTKARTRLGLTGTPMPHSPLDVWAQYRFLDPGIYGPSFWAFRNRFAQMGGYMGREVVGFKDTDKLNERFYSIAVRVTKDVLDLPAVQHLTRTCTLSAEGRAVYDRLQNDMVAGVKGGTVTAANALVKLLRLAQVANGHVTVEDTDSEDGEYTPAGGDPYAAILDAEAGSYTPSTVQARRVERVDDSKANLLAETLDELKGDEPVVIFTRFRADLDRIQELAAKQGRRYAELSGRHPKGIMGLRDWQEGRAEVLGVQLQSGGVGIDLTRSGDRPCKYAVYYSVDFSLGNYDQSLARIHRPGQTEPVVYVHLLTTGTVDEKVYRALDTRRNVVEAVLSELVNGEAQPSQDDEDDEDDGRDYPAFAHDLLDAGAGPNDRYERQMARDRREREEGRRQGVDALSLPSYRR